jgi:hypothetical protein
MKTDALRALTIESSHRMGGKLWPNGLGFDRRGWEFSFSERRHEWVAVCGERFAYGPTPEAAQEQARGRAR